MSLVVGIVDLRRLRRCGASARTWLGRHSWSQAGATRSGRVHLYRGCVCVASRHVEGGARGHRSVRPAASKNIVSLIDMVLRPPLLRCVQHDDAADGYRTHGRGRPARRAPPAGPPAAQERHAQECRTASTRRQRRGARDRSPYLLRHRRSRAPPAQRACATRYPRSTRGGSRAFMRLATRGALRASRQSHTP